MPIYDIFLEVAGLDVNETVGFGEPFTGTSIVHAAVRPLMFTASPLSYTQAKLPSISRRTSRAWRRFSPSSTPAGTRTQRISTP